MDIQKLLPLLRHAAVAASVETYLVGGCVRDGLLGRPLADIDLAVAGDAASFAMGVAQGLGGTFVPIGRRFGTARVVAPQPDGPPLTIDVSSLRGALPDDLALRDFTIDALAVPLGTFDGEWDRSTVIDPLDGRRDLNAGTVRMVSPRAFDDDPLRLLRAVRLSGELGFEVEPATRSAIASRAEKLNTIAPERVREELVRIVDGDGAGGRLIDLEGLGLLFVVFPELAAGRGVAQPKEHYWDVLEHQFETVAATEALTADSPSLGAAREYLRFPAAHRPSHDAVRGYFNGRLGGLSRSAVLKFAALLHDVGKPATRSVQPGGRTRFFGHPELGAQMAEAALTRLRFSVREVRAVSAMVLHHLRPTQMSSDQLPAPRAIQRFFRDLDEVAIDTLVLSLADHAAARGPALDADDWVAHVAMTDFVLEQRFAQEAPAGPRRIVTGDDLIESLGVRPGPVVGALLREIDEARAEGAVETREQALALAERMLAGLNAA
ncbi:MAG: HD domain-containing protein [Dehalococcoidia bacterium]|nr:HD domain-containing protein [Dehalococcoidia bacterium]